MQSRWVAVAALPRPSMLVLHWYVIKVTCDMAALLIWSTGGKPSEHYAAGPHGWL